MGTLSSCSTTPMPLGTAVPYGTNAAYGGGYAPVPSTAAQPWLAPSPVGGGGDAFAGLAQLLTSLTAAVQGLAAALQANTGAGQLSMGGGPATPMPPSKPSSASRSGAASGGGPGAAAGGCGCGCSSGSNGSNGSSGCSHGSKSTPSRTSGSSDELPPIPTSTPGSRSSRQSDRGSASSPPPVLLPDRKPAATPPRSTPSTSTPPKSAPPKDPAPTPPPPPPGTEARILGNGMAFPVKDGKIGQGPHSGGTHSGGPWHDSNALDIMAPEGTPIYAPADGVVSNAKGSNDNPAGRTNGFNMFLEGGDNEWFLTHMSKRLVNNGDHVKKGQLIGYVGSANNVAHLHIGQKNGNPADTFKL